jgi:hypothetical protein
MRRVMGDQARKGVTGRREFQLDLGCPNQTLGLPRVLAYSRPHSIGRPFRRGLFETFAGQQSSRLPSFAVQRFFPHPALG